MDFLGELLQRATARGSRSTALQPLCWLVGLLIGGCIAAVSWNAPPWILEALVALLALTVVLFLCVYVYFAAKDRDALRSERYSLSKLAIERNLVGDNVVGLTEMATNTVDEIAPTALPAPEPDDTE